MPAPYDESVVEEVLKLIRETKMSDSQIAKKVGLGKSTVWRIRRGKFPGEKYRKQREAKAHAEQTLPIVINPDSAEYNHVSVVEYVRCPGCGAKVQAQVACLACEQKKQFADSFECYMNELLTPSPGYPAKVLTEVVDRASSFSPSSSTRDIALVSESLPQEK